MSSAMNPDPQTVMCHECEEEWYRQEHGLVCPACGSEFVELIETMPRQPVMQTPPQNMGATQNIQLNASPFGMYSISGTFHTSGSSASPNPPGAPNDMQQFTNNFMQMVATMVQAPPQAPQTAQTFGGTHQLPGFEPFHQQIPQNLPRQMHDEFSPITSLMGLIFGAGVPSHNMGDYLYTQEDFERVVSELMEQHQSSTAAPPASEAEINALPRLLLTRAMLGGEGGEEGTNKGECSICMDEVTIGVEVATLPCNHWFHMECIRSWLQEHNTCPHCRKSIAAGRQDENREEASRENASREGTNSTSRNSPSRRSGLSNLFRGRRPG